MLCYTQEHLVVQKKNEDFQSTKCEKLRCWWVLDIPFVTKSNVRVQPHLSWPLHRFRTKFSLDNTAFGLDKRMYCREEHPNLTYWCRGQTKFTSRSGPLLDKLKRRTSIHPKPRLSLGMYTGKRSNLTPTTHSIWKYLREIPNLCPRIALNTYHLFRHILSSMGKIQYLLFSRCCERPTFWKEILSPIIGSTIPFSRTKLYANIDNAAYTSKVPGEYHLCSIVPWTWTRSDSEAYMTLSEAPLVIRRPYFYCGVCTRI